MRTPVLRLGFVGLGQAVNLIFRYDPEIADLPIRFTAAADVRSHALESFRRDFGGEVYTSIADLCRSPNVDAVYVATPPELHCAHTLLAAAHGKHVIVEKPMALSIDECEAMNAAADKNGVKLLAGHTHSFDPPIRKMREIVRSEQLGRVLAISSWVYNDFDPRPWPSAELKITRGPILNQGPHQVDIVRLLGGGMVRTVKATTFWDAQRGCEGGYAAHLEFDDGSPATLMFDARGFFDTPELYWWIGEGGAPRDPDMSLKVRRNLERLRTLGQLEMENVLEQQKEQGRYGAEAISPEVWALWGYAAVEERRHQPFFGLTVVSCERGAMRQSPDGVFLYGEDGRTEVPAEKGLKGRAAELMELYQAVVLGRPMFHDGRWGEATLEVCLGILESAKARTEIPMSHQVPVRD